MLDTMIHKLMQTTFRRLCASRFVLLPGGDHAPVLYKASVLADSEWNLTNKLRIDFDRGHKRITSVRKMSVNLDMAIIKITFVVNESSTDGL